MDSPQETSESGQPIYRYNEQQANKFELAHGDAESIAAIENHIEQHLGKIEMVFHELVSAQVHIDIHWVKATDERPYHVLITSGMSDKAMKLPNGVEAPEYLELFMLLPADWKIDEESFKNEDNYWPVRWLKIIARFPHEYNTWVGFGHTIPNGENAEPFANNTGFGCMMLLPSFTVPEEFLDLQTKTKSISFLSLCPLYKDEMDFKLQKGSNALLDLFDQYKVHDIVDIERPNVCEGKK